MKRVPRYIWVDLRLGEGTRCEDASMCFFLGKGVEETRRLLDGFRPSEMNEVRELAPLCGYNPAVHRLALKESQ